MGLLFAAEALQWPILPVLIFVAEMCVTTLATLRIISVSRGMKGFAATFGFFEVSIWLFAIGQVMQNLTDPFCYIAFAAGFTLGNYLGILTEEKLALGNLIVRVITRRDPAELVEALKAESFGVTCINGQGATGPVSIVMTVIKRKELERVSMMLKQFDPRVFYSVDDLQSAEEGVFPRRRRSWAMLLPNMFRPSRAA